MYAAILLSIAVFPTFSLAQNNGPSLDSSIESLRADFKADKVDLINQVMQFNDHDSKVFWPVYRKYEAELTTVNDQRVALIKSYADKFDTMSDADAKSMIQQSFDFEGRRMDVKKKYAKEFEKAGLSALTVAKFMQLEHRLDLVVDMQIAYLLPMLANKPAPAPTN
jgi:hypothetical protein